MDEAQPNGADPGASATPGWDALDRALAEVYGDEEPLHYGTVRRYADGGPDPLDGISIYTGQDPPHWHYVTYGFSELYGKRSDDPATSGFGFELTFRLGRAPDDVDPPSWVLSFLQNLARYVFDSGNRFGVGHHMNLNGPIALEQETTIRAIAFARDPILPGLDSPHGRVEFLQIVGTTLDELDAMREWDTKRFLRLLGRTTPKLVTQLTRSSLLEDPVLRAEIEAGMARDGSSQAMAYVHSLRWEETSRGVSLRLGAIGVENLRRLLRGRTLHARSFYLQGQEHIVTFRAAELAKFELDDDGDLVVELSRSLTEAIVADIEPQRGLYEWEELPGFELEILPSVIKDPDGNLKRVVG